MASTGCATAGSEEGTAPSSDSRLITQEDLSAISVSDAYQAVERLRPLWLLAGTPMSVNQRTEVVVLQDGSYFGDVQSLRQIPAGGIREMRYMTGSEATNRFPFLASGRNVAGAILVSLGGG
jgi:hypothetical protein